MHLSVYTCFCIDLVVFTYVSASWCVHLHLGVCTYVFLQYISVCAYNKVQKHAYTKMQKHRWMQTHGCIHHDVIGA